jgi:hypothetical protein
MIARRPIIYLAGKIGPHDWREGLIGPEIALFAGDAGDERKLFDPRHSIEFPTFFYGGPFYVACDHRCAHGPSNHGVDASGQSGCITQTGNAKYGRRRRVFDVNCARLRNADAVFAYIAQADCRASAPMTVAALAMTAWGVSSSPAASRQYGACFCRTKSCGCIKR